MRAIGLRSRQFIRPRPVAGGLGLVAGAALAVVARTAESQRPSVEQVVGQPLDSGLHRARRQGQDAGTCHVAQRPQRLGGLALALGRREPDLAIRTADQKARECVVVALRDRIELMVMTPRAGDGQAEEGLAEDVEPIVHPIGLVGADVNRRVNLLAQEPEARPLHRFIRPRGQVEPGRAHQVARDVLGQEPVVGDVGVEGADDVVAIAPGVGDGRVELVSSGLSKTDQVEPVPRPALAESWRGEQPIDQPLAGVGRGVRHERIDHLRGGRQARQVERDPTREGARAGIGGRLEALGFERGEHEPIDRVARPRGVVDDRRNARLDRLPGPVRGFAGGQVEARRGGGRRWPARSRGPRHADLDPSSEDGDLVLRQPRLRRHLDGFAIVDRLHQKAFAGLARHGRRSGLATGKNPLARVEPQSGFRFFGPMTGVTTLNEDRADLGLKELQRSRVGRFRRSRLSQKGHDPERSDRPTSTRHEPPPAGLGGSLPTSPLANDHSLYPTSPQVVESVQHFLDSEMITRPRLGRGTMPAARGKWTRGPRTTRARP